MVKKIRAAVVGYGNIGRYVVEALEAAPDFEVAGIVRRSIAGECPSEIACYDVVDDIRKLENVDIAVLATPTRKVEEYAKETMLAFEKEVLGVYISGHPLEAYEKFLTKNVTAVTTDFLLDDETGESRVHDNENVIIGGMITSKTVKTTKNNKMMAFVTLEDLVGTVEVVIFPNDYEKHQRNLNVDQKVYIKGRVSASEDQQAKLVCERIIPFDEIPKEIWIKFDSKADYLKRENELYKMIEHESGSDRIVIFCAKEKAVKRLENRFSIRGDERMMQILHGAFGEENVKVRKK